MFVWFDPKVERLDLRDLTEAEKISYLDSERSVSGLGEGEGRAELIDGCDPAERVLRQLTFDLGERS